MKYRITALLCALALAASLLAGCGQASPSAPDASSASGTSSASGSDAADSAFAPDTAADPAVQTERVPVLDEQYAGVLNGYHVVGSFCDGVAFAARYLPMTEEDYASESGMPRVECGYVTLDGTYTPLYTVPSELELLDPAAGRRGLHGSVDDTFLYTEDGMLIYQGDEPEYNCVPSVIQQKAIDDTFSVGDNGWVPYYENGKWGYCDLTGNVTLAPAYDFVSPFSAGKALVCNYDGALYTWMIIDETGVQLTVFEPAEMFALRSPDSEFVFQYNKTYGCMYNIDGTQLTPYADSFSHEYRDNGGYAVQRGFVYNTQGVLYKADDLELVGVQDGCAVYKDGTRYGIRGSDGAVRVEARFDEICRLAPEGFYAREGSNQVNLYDYDGNLIEEAPACVRVVEHLDGYVLYDGTGALLAQYQASESNMESYSMNGDTFFTGEGFLYLHLSEQDFVTLHITFEERPVQQASGTSDPSDEAFPQGASLTMQTGQTVSVRDSSFDKRGVLQTTPRLSFVSWDFDSYDATDRSSILLSGRCSEGLEWYETMSHEVVVCDPSMNPVFTVPQDVLTQVRGSQDGSFFPGTPSLLYAGDGLWTITVGGYDTEYFTSFVFDRAGNLVWSGQNAPNANGVNTGYSTARANEGYFFVSKQQNEFYTMTGEPVAIQPAGEETVQVYEGGSWFDGGLANTIYGYVDPQGNVVLSAGQLQRDVSAWLQVPQGRRLQLELSPFDGEEAVLYAEISNENYTGPYEYKAVRIDRTGKVLGSEDLQDNIMDTVYDMSFERSDEIQRQVYAHLVRRPFSIVNRKGPNGQTLLTPDGVQVTAPEEIKFGYDLIQWDNRFAFVEINPIDDGEYIPVDAAGRAYPELAQGWQYIYASASGTAYGVKRVNSNNRVDHYELTPIQISIS